MRKKLVLMVIVMVYVLCGCVSQKSKDNTLGEMTIDNYRLTEDVSNIMKALDPSQVVTEYKLNKEIKHLSVEIWNITNGNMEKKKILDKDVEIQEGIMALRREDSKIILALIPKASKGGSAYAASLPDIKDKDNGKLIFKANRTSIVDNQPILLYGESYGKSLQPIDKLDNDSLLKKITEGFVVVAVFSK